LSDLAADAAPASAAELVVDGRSYRLVTLLGQGPDGIVYLAEAQPPLPTFLAIKVLRPRFDSSSIVARYEAQHPKLSALHHPCIAPTLHAGLTAAGQAYFVTEYVPGLALDRYAERFRLAAADRITLVRQICEAIQHAHDRGIPHLNLKPSNIRVESIATGPSARVIEFGVAASIRPAASARGAEYPRGGAHEIGRGIDDRSDCRADIHALGVLLRTLVGSAVPAVDHVVQRALEEDPCLSYASAADLGHDLAEIIIS
jgi:serine/threonine protein kinase